MRKVGSGLPVPKGSNFFISIKKSVLKACDDIFASYKNVWFREVRVSEKSFKTKSLKSFRLSFFSVKLYTKKR